MVIGERTASVKPKCELLSDAHARRVDLVQDWVWIPSPSKCSPGAVWQLTMFCSASILRLDLSPSLALHGRPGVDDPDGSPTSKPCS